MPRKIEDRLFSLNQNQGGAGWDVDLDILLMTSPGFRSREVSAVGTDTIMSSKVLLIRVEQDLVLARGGDSNTVVCE